MELGLNAAGQGLEVGHVAAHDLDDLIHIQGESCLEAGGAFQAVAAAGNHARALLFRLSTGPLVSWRSKYAKIPSCQRS